MYVLNYIGPLEGTVKVDDIELFCLWCVLLYVNGFFTRKFPESSKCEKCYLSVDNDLGFP